MDTILNGCDVRKCPPYEDCDGDTCRSSRMDDFCLHEIDDMSSRQRVSYLSTLVARYVPCDECVIPFAGPAARP
jgi:hypothetical protein